MSNLGVKGHSYQICIRLGFVWRICTICMVGRLQEVQAGQGLKVATKLMLMGSGTDYMVGSQRGHQT